MKRTLRGVLLALLGAVDAQPSGPAAFQGSNWYLASLNKNCVVTCAEVGLACDGNAHTAYSLPTKPTFESLLVQLGVAPQYCTGFPGEPTE